MNMMFRPTIAICGQDGPDGTMMDQKDQSKDDLEH